MASLSHYLSLLGITDLQNINLGDLKKAFRSRILEAHPDKGGEADSFDSLLSAFVYVNDAMRRVKGGRASMDDIKSPDALRAERVEQIDTFIEAVFEEFEREKFNKEFEKLHLSGLGDGYSEWFSGSGSVSESGSAVSKTLNYQELLNSVRIQTRNDLTEQNFNSVFVTESRQGKPEPLDIILHPDSMATFSGQLLGENILNERPNTFTSPFGTSPEFSDLYNAYSQDNIICDKVRSDVDSGTDIDIDKRLEEYIQQRSSEMKPLTDTELEELQAYEKEQMRLEKERRDKVTEYLNNKQPYSTIFLQNYASNVTSSDSNNVVIDNNDMVIDDTVIDNSNNNDISTTLLKEEETSFIKTF